MSRKTMTKKIPKSTDDVGLETPSIIEVPSAAPRVQEPAPATDRRARAGLVVVVALVATALVLGFWLVARDSAPDLGPSQRDATIERLLREQQTDVSPSQRDATIERLLREQQTDVSPSHRDATIERLLRDRAGTGE